MWIPRTAAGVSHVIYGEIVLAAEVHLCKNVKFYLEIFGFFFFDIETNCQHIHSLSIWFTLLCNKFNHYPK